MIKIWKQKAPKQAKWFTKHPTQVLQQAKRVWKWSVESGKGKAWLYFVFAICQWLPTNYRMNYSLDGPRKICNLCLCNSMDTMDHLLVPLLPRNILTSNNKLTPNLNSWTFLTLPLPLNPAITNSAICGAPRPVNIFLPTKSQISGWNSCLKASLKPTAPNQLSQLANSWKTYQIYSPSEGQRPTNSGKT